MDLYDFSGHNEAVVARNQRLSRPIGEAKARFAECIREAEGGATIVLTRHGRPVALLAPFRRDAGTEAVDEVAESPAAYPDPAEETFTSTEAKLRSLRRFLDEEIRPLVPEELRGRGVSKAERERILGYEEAGRGERGRT
jgi:prevent-host-death family protein